MNSDTKPKNTHLVDPCIEDSEGVLAHHALDKGENFKTSEGGPADSYMPKDHCFSKNKSFIKVRPVSSIFLGKDSLNHWILKLKKKKRYLTHTEE